MSEVLETPAVVADRLEQLNAVINGGRGSSVCRSVIQELRRNDVGGAIAIVWTDFDKVRQYPRMAALFEEVGLLDDRPIS